MLGRLSGPWRNHQIPHVMVSVSSAEPGITSAHRCAEGSTEEKPLLVVSVPSLQPAAAVQNHPQAQRTPHKLSCPARVPTFSTLGLLPEPSSCRSPGRNDGCTRGWVIWSALCYETLPGRQWDQGPNLTNNNPRYIRLKYFCLFNNKKKNLG